MPFLFLFPDTRYGHFLCALVSSYLKRGVIVSTGIYVLTMLLLKSKGLSIDKTPLPSFPLPFFPLPIFQSSPLSSNEDLSSVSSHGARAELSSGRAVMRRLCCGRKPPSSQGTPCLQVLPPGCNELGTFY